MKTVRELIELLIDVEAQDAYVALASDPEGNDFHFIADVEPPTSAEALDLEADRAVVVFWP